jgi:hypothetical protein
MKCYVCGCGPFTAALHRVNEKGVTGIWACSAHFTGEVDEVVASIITVVEQDNRDRRRLGAKQFWDSNEPDA